MSDAQTTTATLTASVVSKPVGSKEETTASPGSGYLHLSHPHRARFSTLRASYPLKLLAPDALPSQPASLAVCYTLAYGGGLVAGDVVSLRVMVDEGCGLIMLTQGSTKVFKQRAGIRPLSHQIIRQPPVAGDSAEDRSFTRQRLHGTLQPGSLLLLLPDSVSPFRQSRYSQVQRFILPSCRTASVVILDWVNSGRGQRGQGLPSASNEEAEVWAMDHYGSSNEVFLGEELIMRERMVLDNPDTSYTPNRSASRPSKTARQLAPYHVYATVLILGPQTATLQAYLHQRSLATSQMQINRPQDLLWAYSQTHEQGGVLRVAGKEVEGVKSWLRSVLDEGGIRALVGDGLWPRLI